MVNLMEYTTRIFELGSIIENSDPDNKVSVLPAMEELVSLNVDIISQMEVGRNELPDDYNDMCDSTIDVIDEIITIYKDQGRTIQVQNFESLRDKLIQQKVGIKSVIHVIK